MATHTEVDEEVVIKAKNKFPWHILLHNDHVNTFEHAIECLMKYCGHTELQAEQCALIVHSAGQCSVKIGQYDELRPIWEALLDNHLKATIEET